MGIRNLEVFNRVLMVKWLWRFLVGKGNLWCRIVRSCHGEVEWGEDGLSLRGSGSSKSGWWSKIVDLGNSLNGNWVRVNLSRKVGCGSEIKFWHHVWLESLPLKVIFPRLFRLSSFQDCNISDVGEWENGVWVWKLSWRRALFVRESESVDQLLNVLNNFAPSAGTPDGWTWKASRDGVYSTKSAYTAVVSASNDAPTDSEKIKFLKMVWKAPVPHKAMITSWRLLKNRLPTCDNLSKRRIQLLDDNMKCSACGQQDESADHIFLHCPKTSIIWDELMKWIGVQSARPSQIGTFFDMFSHLGKCKQENRLLLSIWVCTVWMIWKQRNECKFENSK